MTDQIKWDNFTPIENQPNTAGLPSRLLKESDMRQVVAMSPQERAESNAAEALPAWSEELDREIARQRDPKLRAVLEEERAKRNGGPQQAAALADSGIKWDDFSPISSAKAAEKPYDPMVDVNAPKVDGEGIVDSFTRNMGKTLPQTKQLLSGSAALIADTIGADSVRDWFMDSYKSGEHAVQEITRPTDAWSESGKDNIGKFIAGSSGYFVGQMLESAAVALSAGAIGTAAGGVGAIPAAAGGLLLKSSAKLAIKEATETLIAAQMKKSIAAGATESVARKAAEQIGADLAKSMTKKLAGRELGVGAAMIAQGVGMETGEIYGDLYTKAKAEGRDVTDEERQNAWLYGSLAGAVEGIVDKYNLDAVMGGGAKAPGLKNRLMGVIRGAAKAEAREVPTEIVQTGLERAGKGEEWRPSDPEAMKEYGDTAAMTAAGSWIPGLGGAMVSKTPATPAPAPTAPQPNSPLTNAANAGTPAAPVSPAAGIAGTPAFDQATANTTNDKVAAIAERDQISQQIANIQGQLQRTQPGSAEASLLQNKLQAAVAQRDVVAKRLETLAAFDAPAAKRADPLVESDSTFARILGAAERVAQDQASMALLSPQDKAAALHHAAILRNPTLPESVRRDSAIAILNVLDALAEHRADAADLRQFVNEERSGLDAARNAAQYDARLDNHIARAPQGPTSAFADVADFEKFMGEERADLDQRRAAAVDERNAPVQEGDFARSTPNEMPADLVAEKQAKQVQPQPTQRNHDANVRPDAVQPITAQSVEAASQPPAAVAPVAEKEAEAQVAQETVAAISAATPQETAQTAPDNESVQDKSFREWGENYSAVTGDIKAASEKNIVRAIGYASKMIAAYQPRAFDGDERAKSMIDSLNREIDGLQQEIKARERTAEPTPKPAAKKSGRAIDKTIDPERDSLFMAIARLGGMKTDDVIGGWGHDKKDFKNGRMMGDGLRVLTSKGMPADGVLEHLKQFGYFDQEATLTDFEQAFREELSGNLQFTPEGYQHGAAENAEAQHLAALAAEEVTDIPEYHEASEPVQLIAERIADDFADIPMFDEAGYDANSPDNAAAEAAFLGTTMENGNGPEQSTNQNTPEGQGATDVAAESGPAQGAVAGAATGFALESQDEASLAAEARKQQAIADAARQADAKAKADADLGGFALAGSNRAADANPGQMDFAGNSPTPVDSALAKAQADLDTALDDLGSIFRNSGLTNRIIAESDIPKLIPVLTRVMDAAFRLGFHTFKASVRESLRLIREKFGDEAADALTIDHLQGAYIAGVGSKEGATPKKEVVSFDTVADVLAETEAVREAIEQAEKKTAVNPTEAQKESGNYVKGKVRLYGQDISIETPKGAERTGKGENGEEWRVSMPASYGYFLGTVGADGEHVDVFLGEHPESQQYWVVNQTQPDSTQFDEHKILLGYNNEMNAQADYLLSFSGDFGHRVLGSVVGPFPVDGLADALAGMKKKAPTVGPVEYEAALMKLPSPVAQVQNKEVTSETARRGEYTLKSGETGRVVESARRGEFSVTVGNTFGSNMESMGVFSMDDAGNVGKVSARANWAMDNVRDAADQFSSEYRSTRNEDIPAPANWRKSYGAMSKYAEALGIPLRGENKKFLKVPELLAAIDAKLAGESNSPFANSEQAPAEELSPLTKARNDLMEMEARAEDQGRIADDRLLTKIRQQKQIIKELEAEGEQASAENVSQKAEKPDTSAEPVQKTAETAQVSLDGRTIHADNLTDYFDGTTASLMRDPENPRTEQRVTANDGKEYIARYEGRVGGMRFSFSAAPAVESKPVNEDPKNSPVLDEVDGFRAGDVVDVPSRTVGRSSIEYVYRRALAGMGPVGIARIRYGDGRMLDIGTSELEKVQTDISAAVPSTVALTFIDDISPLIDKQLQKQKSRVLRLRTEQKSKQTLSEKNQHGLKITAAEASLRKMRQDIFKAEDAAKKVLETGDISHFADYAMLFGDAAEKLSLENVKDVADTGAKEPQNEPTGNGRTDQGALAAVSPGVVSGTEGERDAGQGSDRLREADAAGNGSAEADRDESAGSVDREPQSVLPERPAETVEISGETVPLEQVAEQVKHDAPASEPKGATLTGKNPGNYVITDADQIGTGTAGERIRANMAAIRLVLDLEREQRYATPEEQATLVKYVGWGGLKNVFKPSSDSKQEREALAELKKLLTEQQLFWMGQTVLDAHYTSPKIIRAKYKILRHFGVTGGRFLEPTVGSGNFIGLMPSDMAASSKWYASEIDPITSLIAKHAYPDAQVLTSTGFQEAEFAYGRFDVAIGNPPFGDQTITDTNPKRAEINGQKIHNYIISKSGMHLRPGGILSMVVTSRFLDTANPEARGFLDKNFRFLGAIRLPNNAFKDSAGTEVTTDLIFLQKLRDGQRAGDDAWLDTNGRMLNEDGETVTLNRYFAEHQETLLGKPTMQGTMYGSRTEKGEFTLQPIDGLDADAKIDELLAGAWAGFKGIARKRPEDADVQAAEVMLNREDVPTGGFFTEGSRVLERIDDDEQGNAQFRELTAETKWTEKTALGKTRLDRIKGILGLREDAYALMAAERADVPVERLDVLRAALNARYDAFVNEFGFLNDRANVTLFDDDARIEFGLESSYKKAVSPATAKRTGHKASPASAEKSALLVERVFFPTIEIDHADTPRDGYSVSLSQRGKLDIDYIASLTNLSAAEVIADLSAGESPLIFKDPMSNKWVQEDEYLSGNVKAKLKEAKAAGADANVRALEAVQPADVPPGEVHAEFGATWVPSEIYEDFLKTLGYSSATVVTLKKMGQVEVARVGNKVASEFASDLENPDFSIESLFVAIANRRPLIAYDGTADNRVVNQERTDALKRIAKKLLAIWSDWVKADDSRADALAKEYNETMNTTVERKFDGVTHLVTVGANPTISLRNSQKNSAWRMIQSPVVLMDHVVGAGKTIALITGLMERGRLGLSRKPMVVVPNHLVGQWSRDWMQLYPGANILAATEKDFSKQNRRRLFARIATGNFDAVIVGHSSFGHIPVSKEAEVDFMMAEVEHLEAALSEAKSATDGDKKESRTVRSIKNRIAKRLEKIKDLQDKPRDNVATFEDMGVDYTAIDECFPYETPVLTNQGWISIGEIVEKQLQVSVISNNINTGMLEWKPVVRWIPVNRKKTMVKVTHEHGHITCTADHKFWTDRGYVEAQALLQTDSVFVLLDAIHPERPADDSLRSVPNRNEGMREMREPVQFPVGGAGQRREAPLLLESVRSDLAQQSGWSYREIQCVDGRQARGEATRQKVSGIRGADESKQSDGQPGNGREDAAEGRRTNISVSRGELENHSSSAETVGATRSSDGVCDQHKGSSTSIRESAELLQGRSGQSAAQVVNRSGREQSQNKEVEISGSAQNFRLERAGVVSVEILESADIGQSRGGCGDYSTVYDIEVEGNHNFIAAGCLVSNCHEFKNLEYSTTLSNIAGMGSPEGSKKAFDLYMKMQLIQQRDGGIAFATGTPLSNSMVEMYTILRYLNRSALEDRGIIQFDAWAKTFASIESRDEYTATGKIKARTVMAAFNNLPELLQLYKQVADTVTMTDLKRIYADQMRTENTANGTKKREDFPVPKVKGGGRRLDMGEPTEGQSEFMDYLMARAEILDKKKGKDKQEYAKIDNALWLMNDARKMSLDVRTSDPSAVDEPNNKVNRAARQIKAIYDNTTADLGTQLVFCDLSTPSKVASKDAKDFIKKAIEKLGLKDNRSITLALDGKTFENQWKLLAARADQMLDAGHLTDAERERVEEFIESVSDEDMGALLTADSGFSVYDALKEKLIEAGISEREIAFIHDAGTVDKKEELFGLVNAGKVRVLIGSSQKMGAGTNVQQRVVALHHMDAPWRPSDMEQREGRVIRQGNKLYLRNPDGFEVEIIAYSTARTFDAQMWAVLARKAGFLEQFRMGLRSIKEDGGDAAGYAEFMAEATGNPIFREKIVLEREVEDLEAEDRSAKMKLMAARRALETADARREGFKESIAALSPIADNPITAVTFEGKTYANDLAEVAEAEFALFNQETDAYLAEQEVYKAKRADWEAAAGTERGRAPHAPEKPEYPDTTSARMRNKSQWAKLIGELVMRMSVVNKENGGRRFTLTTQDGNAFHLEASPTWNDGEVEVAIDGAGYLGSGKPLGTKIPQILRANSIRGNFQQSRGSSERSLASLETSIAQASLTLNRIKPIDPALIQKAKDRYAEVVKQVDEIAAQLSEERAGKDNRYINRDKKRFGADWAAAVQVAQATRREAGDTPSVLARSATDADPAKVSIGIDKPAADAALAEILSTLKLVPEYSVAARFADLPPEVQQEARNQDAEEGNTKGLFHKGTLYVVANNHSTMADLQETIFHELIGHYGMRQLLGPQVTQKMNAFFASLGGTPGLRKIAQANGFGPVFDEYIDGLAKANRNDPQRYREEVVTHILTEEVFAHMAQQPIVQSKVRQIVAALRDWLREHGFGNLLTMNDQDIIFLLAKAKKNLEDGPNGGGPRGGVKVPGTLAKMDQIKSAIGNNGDFDSSSPDIRYARAPKYTPVSSSAEISAAVASLNAEMENQQGLSNAFSVSNEVDPEMADVFAKTFGVELVPIRPNHTDASQFAGISFNGKIYANTSHPRYSFSALAGHELLHQLKSDNRQLYDAFAKMAYPRAIGGIENTLLNYGAHPENQGYAQSELSEELLADFVGDALSDRAFLEQMATKNPSMFRQFADYVLRWLDGVAKKLTGSGFGSSQYFSDVQGLRDELADVLSIYSGQKESGNIDPESPVTVLRRSPTSALSPDNMPALAAKPLPSKISGYIQSLFANKSLHTFNILHKTVSSQFHKAKIDRDYGRVVERAQQFIEDVARYGSEASDQAPGLLPKMDTIASALREATHFARDKADAKAIADPVFKGTLYESPDGQMGKVWTDEELRNQFALNPRQVDLYRQFRRTVDHSLEALAVAEMNKVAKANDLTMPDGELDMRELADFYSAQFGNTLRELKERLERLKADATGDNDALWQNAVSLNKGRAAYHEALMQKQAEEEAAQARLMREIETLQAVWDGIVGKKNTILKLQREGYAPLMRFGKYTVDVVEKVPALDESGKTVIDRATGEMKMEDKRHFFGMFETQKEAADAKSVFDEEYPDAEVTTGIASEDGWQLFGSVNADSLEMLARLAGKEDEVVQKFYKEALASRSALKRLIHRQGIAGYSNDVTRTLASFVLANARATASAKHFGELMEAAADIPKHKGDVKDEAVKLINYIRNPNEEAGWLRGLLFVQFLGGSIAAAAINLTQTATTTFPFLHQFGVTVSDVVSAARMARKRMSKDGLTGDEALDKALALAEADGVVSPHNIHALMGETSAQGMTRHRSIRLLSHIWGSMFGMAEQFNRETAFIAAYRHGVKIGYEGLTAEYEKRVELNRSRGLQPPSWKDFSSPFDFAKNAVNETQFVLSKAARPNWARGTVGATVMTFKQFSIFYIELLKRMPNKERALMLATLIVLAGVGGVPFGDDSDDLLDTIGQALGYDTNAKRWKENFATNVFGQHGGNFVMHGISAGLPIELSSRLGMANLVPATGIMKKSNSGRRDKEISELLGAAGGYYKQLSDALDYTLQGRYAMAATQGFLPKAMKDVAKAIDMASSGTYDDSHGRRVTDVTTLDALVKAIGFQPTAVSEVQRAKGLLMQDIGLNRSVKASIAEIWAQGIHDNDAGKKAAAQQMLAEWNEKNPDSPITVKRSQVLQRAQQMSKSAAERMINASPKEMRSRVKAAMEVAD